MNRPSKFPATDALPLGLSGNTGAAEGCSPVPTVAPTFRFREAICEHCDWPIYTSCACECEGRGLVDCACADCGNVLALNDEGLCQRCHAASTLPLDQFNAIYRPHLLCAERLGPGRIAL